MKFYFLYKVIHIPTQRYYLGKHETKNLKDGYMGSGVAWGNILRAHDREEFSFQILSSYENSTALERAEEILIPESILLDPLCMNLVPGGRGGAGPASHVTPEQRKKNGKIAAEKLRGRTKETHEYLARAGQKISRHLKNMSDESKAALIAKSLLWLSDEKKLAAAIEKTANKNRGRTKENHAGRLSQANKISGSGNGAAKSAVKARASVQYANIPLDLLAKRYSVEKQLYAITALCTSNITNSEAAQIVPMPISSFNTVFRKIVQHSLNTKLTLING